METLVHILHLAEDTLAETGQLALLAMAAFAVLALLWRTMARLRRRMSRLAMAFFMAVSVGAAILADKRAGDRAHGDGGREEDGGRGGGEVQVSTNLCFSSISLSTNALGQGIVSLGIAWPTNLLADGEIIDVFAKTNLLDEAWTWAADTGAVDASQTNAAVSLPLEDVGLLFGTNAQPQSLFFMANARSTVVDSLSDADGDGLPDIWETAHGLCPTNAADAYDDPDGDGLINVHVSCIQSPSALRSVFFEPVVSGDSGNPRFLIMGDSVVLLCTMWTTGGNGAGAGCLLTNLKDQIQDAMNNLAIGFQLQECDLSSFDELPQKGIGDYDYE